MSKSKLHFANPLEAVRTRRASLPAVRLLAVLAALALAAALFGVLPVQGQMDTTLVSNTGQNSGLVNLRMTVDKFPKWSQAFTTGSNPTGYTLTSIGIDFAVIDDTATAGDQLEVRLHQVKSNGDPGDALCTLSDPASFSSPGVNTFAAPTSGVGACPALATGSTYAVVAERVSGTASTEIIVTGTNSDMEDSSPAAGWSISDTSHTYVNSSIDVALSMFWSEKPFPYRIEIKGEALVPATLVKNTGQTIETNGNELDDNPTSISPRHSAPACTPAATTSPRSG